MLWSAGATRPLSHFEREQGSRSQPTVGVSGRKQELELAQSTKWAGALACLTLMSGWAAEGGAVTFESMNGAPVQMQPYVDEPGAPAITVPLGRIQQFDGLTGTGDASGNTSTGSEALNTMVGTTWGANAVAAAQAIGVNPSVLAATCVVESGCQNVAGTGTVSGAFQMTNATYTSDMNQVVAQNPQLAGIVDTSLAGKMDPANQAYGAAQDLKNAAMRLQAVGIANPTFTDVRPYFQWGPAPASSIALASPDQNISELLSPYYSTAQMQANGVTGTTTVGEWRASFSNKVGSAATQQVLM